MRLIIQRVSSAKVTVDSQITGQIGPGFLVLVGFGIGDNEPTVEKITAKLLKLRIMPDQNSKFNLSITDIGGEILVVSQFTLYAHLKGNRPSFTDSLEPNKARQLYDYFINKLKLSGLKVESGIFGAYMKADLTNDGPVTIIMES